MVRQAAEFFTYFLAAPPVIDVSAYEPDGCAALLNKFTSGPQAHLVFLKQIENMISDNALVIPNIIELITQFLGPMICRELIKGIN